MVAARRTAPLVLALTLMVSLGFAPAATALGGLTPGIGVAESTPVDVTHLVRDGGRVTDAATEVVEAVAAPAPLPEVAVQPVPVVHVATPREWTAQDALLALPDSGLTLEQLLLRHPELAALLDALVAEVATVTPEPTPEAALAMSAPGIAAGVAGATALSLAFQPPALARFYTRLAPGTALKNPMRRRVYETIAADPGVHANALRERTGLGNGALIHHLDVLKREGLVTRVAAGRFTRYYVTGKYSRGAMLSHATSLAGSARRVLEVVQDRPGVPVKDAAAQVGLSVPSVHRTAARLEQAGLVERRRQGRGHALYPAEEAAATLA